MLGHTLLFSFLLLASATLANCEKVPYSGVRFTTSRASIYRLLQAVYERSAESFVDATFPSTSVTLGSGIFSSSFSLSNVRCTSGKYDFDTANHTLTVENTSFVLVETGAGLNYSFSAEWDFTLMGIHLLFGKAEFTLTSTGMSSRLPLVGQNVSQPSLVVTWTSPAFQTVSGALVFSSMVSAWIEYLYMPVLCSDFAGRFKAKTAVLLDTMLAPMLHMSDNRLSDDVSIVFENYFYKMVEYPAGYITTGFETISTVPASKLSKPLRKILNTEVILTKGHYAFCVSSAMMVSMLESAAKAGLYAFNVAPAAVGLLGIVYDLAGIMPRIDLLYDGRAPMRILCGAAPDKSILMLSKSEASGLNSSQFRLQVPVQCNFSLNTTNKLLLSVSLPTRATYTRTAINESTFAGIQGTLGDSTLYNIEVLSSAAAVEGTDTLTSLGMRITSLLNGMAEPYRGWLIGAPSSEPVLRGFDTAYDETCLTFGPE